MVSKYWSGFDPNFSQLSLPCCAPLYLHSYVYQLEGKVFSFIRWNCSVKSWQIYNLEYDSIEEAQLDIEEALGVIG